jgi:hypothetical protein
VRARFFETAIPCHSHEGKRTSALLASERKETEEHLVINHIVQIEFMTEEEEKAHQVDNACTPEKL